MQMVEDIVKTREQNAISDRSELELHPTFRNFFWNNHKHNETPSINRPCFVVNL
jgi:hypothetical protein